MAILHRVPTRQVHTLHLDLINGGKKDAAVTLQPGNIAFVIPKKSAMHLGPFVVEGQADLELVLGKGADDVRVIGAVRSSNMVPLDPGD